MSLLRHRKKQPSRTPRFFHRFARNTEAPFSEGNRVELFEHGGKFFPALFDALATARTCICLEFYIIRDDSTGRALANILLAAAGRGVSVCLIYDYIGCFDTPSAYFRKLERGGITCLPFNPPPFKQGIAWFDKRDHRKMVIIDGRTAFAGGHNIGDEYGGSAISSEHWRDVGIRLEGPAVAELSRVFRESWYLETKNSPLCTGDCLSEQVEKGDARVMIVSGGPHLRRTVIRNAFRLAIGGASESVRIMNPYFVPGPRIMRSLIRAARRGVQVQLLLPAKSDVWLVSLVSRSYYGPLLKEGVEIYELEGTFLHAKVMLIDDKWTVLGSANLDQRSFHRNYEVNAIVDSPAFGHQMEHMFGEDIPLARRILLEEHERRGWLVQAMERLCGTISWFL